MFKLTARRFLAVLAAALFTLTYLWVSAGTAHAAECRRVGPDVVMCEGSELPEAPRGTARRLPRVTHGQPVIVRGSTVIGERLGTTVVVARFGRAGGAS